jgi:hypothetical protein
MVFQPSEKFWKAVLNLQASEDFKTIRQEIQRYQLLMGMRFGHFQGDDLAKLQGRSLLAMELLQKFDPDYARKELANLELKAKEASQKPLY